MSNSRTDAREDELTASPGSPSGSDSASTPAHPDSAQGQARPQGFIARTVSFLWDSPEERERKKAAAAAGQSPGKPSKGQRASASGPPTKVSKRARIMGNKRGRATALMAAIVAFSLLTIVNSVMIVTLMNQPDANEAAQKALRQQGRDFPEGQAVSWAEQVVADWGTWDEGSPDSREVRMAQYLTAGMDPQAGWNGHGTQSVEFVSANTEPTVIDQHRALVDVSYRLDDNSRRCVSVPVYAYKPKGLAGHGAEVQWAFGLSGNPVPTPCAPRTGAPDVEDPLVGTPHAGREDLVANDELSNQLTSDFFPEFFSAWAASDANSLRQYTASGVTTIGLGGAMTSTPPPSIDNAVIYTPEEGKPQEGKIYYATVPVVWTMAGASSQVQAVYRVPMSKSGDRWYVAGEPKPSPTAESARGGAPAQKVKPDKGTEPEEGTNPKEGDGSPTSGETPSQSSSPSPEKSK